MGADTRYLIWLSGIPGLGDRHKRTLCNRFGSARAVFEFAKRDDLVDALSPFGESCKPLADAVVRGRSANPPDALDQMLFGLGCTAFSCDDEGYPSLLKTIDKPPLLLYVCGTAGIDPKKTLAIVGTRRNSRYGGEVAHRIARDLAWAGVCVVSGMADGIDAFAHKGALESNGNTIGVLGCGVDVIYPSANRALYHDIRSKGAVVSEFFPGTKPLPYHFPARNRIISGMCAGVLVVECPEHSGAMITARLCIEQGRELFVVPGNITSPQAAGSNSLLMMGASPALTAQDILDRFGWGQSLSEAAEEQLLSSLDKRVCDALYAGELFLDDLAAVLEENVGALLGHLTLMEIRGIIKQLPGQRFALSGR
jgi:DNA processing protein